MTDSQSGIGRQGVDILEPKIGRPYIAHAFPAFAMLFVFVVAADLIAAEGSKKEPSFYEKLASLDKSCWEGRLAFEGAEYGILVQFEHIKPAVISRNDQTKFSGNFAVPICPGPAILYNPFGWWDRRVGPPKWGI